MTKKELIELRDKTQDPELKRGLRYAIDRIDALEARLRKVSLLAEVVVDNCARDL